MGRWKSETEELTTDKLEISKTAWSLLTGYRVSGTGPRADVSMLLHSHTLQPNVPTRPSGRCCSFQRVRALRWQVAESEQEVGQEPTNSSHKLSPCSGHISLAVVIQKNQVPKLKADPAPHTRSLQICANVYGLLQQATAQGFSLANSCKRTVTYSQTWLVLLAVGSMGGERC